MGGININSVELLDLQVIIRQHLYYYMVCPDLNTEVMIQRDLQFATAKVIQRLLKRKAD